MSESKGLVPDESLPPWERLKLIMAILRSKNGCSWDRKQTHKSLLPYLIEETYEVVEAVEAGDHQALCDELGDLLCQVVFHAQLAREQGAFEADDAVKSIVDKLIERHPHVFGKPDKLRPDQVRNQWEKLKIESGKTRSVLSGLPASMPALAMAFRIGEKAAGAGFDWVRPADVFDKLEEEIDEIKSAAESGDKEHLAEELGDLLFAAASLARKLEIDPETALKRALKKFRRRFEELETRVNKGGNKLTDLTLEQLEEIWQEIKTPDDQG